MIPPWRVFVSPSTKQSVTTQLFQSAAALNMPAHSLKMELPSAGRGEVPVALARKATYLLGKDWLQSAAEENHVLWTAEGRKPLFCWGQNHTGQLTAPRNQVFVDLSSGFNYSCALKRDGTAVCWGGNEFGEASPPEGQRFATIKSSLGLGEKTYLRP